MGPRSLPEHSSARSVAALGGVVYALVVLAWAFTTGIQFSESLVSTAIGVGYAAAGTFLLAAVPLYLLGRRSLVSPILVTGWALGHTIYLRRYAARPHDALASYLTVWPLVLGLVVGVAAAEWVVRVGLDRVLGRFGPRSLF
ncbi:hypothetical protein [Salinigranum sp. GCM10025319]|uniref:hypothetical protein n=1 Tax=Salinigranum sp. GCM10025319 TaxID=3252687 RepID=UPI00360C2AD0